MSYIVSLILVLLYSISSFFSDGRLSSPYLCMFFSLGLSVWYIIKYRSKHLFCFEFLFLLIHNLISFFNIIVNEADLSRYYFIFNQSTIDKAYLVSLIGLCSLLLGEYFIEKDTSSEVKKETTTITCHLIDYEFASMMNSLITLIYIVFLFITRQYAVLFKYVDSSQVNAANTVIVFTTILLFSNSVVEFIKLFNLGDYRLLTLWKRCNKLYAFEIVFVTMLLFTTGNRNEALFVVVPAIALYDILISRINNKSFFVIAVFASILMILIGLTRQGTLSVSESINNLSFYETVRDFSSAGISNMYLIDYADAGNINYGLNGLVELFSSVPFLGGFVVSVFNIKTQSRSATLTTEGILGNTDVGGMGTGLVGDFYYTGKIYAVIIGFFLLGCLMAYLHKKIFIQKMINPYHLIIYIFMISDSFYYARSEWYTPFRYIGFTIIIYFVFTLTMKKKIRL